ncbi:permease, partial [Escherichia coli]|nr:permease [Escherichia coli]
SFRQSCNSILRCPSISDGRLSYQFSSDGYIRRSVYAYDGAVDNSLMWVVAMAVAGCLFVIPTAAEIPIVQTMMLAGMGTAPALALLMTLPAVSLPSLIMLRKAFPAKALWLTGAMVAVSGVIVGGLALLV